MKLNLLKISGYTLSLIFVTNSVRATGIDSLIRQNILNVCETRQDYHLID
jgi:hypothetical protein